MNGTITTDFAITRRTSPQRAAAWAGIVAPLVFIATFVALEVLQGSEYDRVADTVSTLAAGSHGWVQGVNFVVFGVLTMVFAVGLHRSIAPSRAGIAGPAVLGVSAVANVVAAAFPVRLEADGTTYAPAGHLVGGMVFFSTAAVSLILLSRRLGKDPRWSGLAAYTAISGVVAVVGFVLMGALVMPDDAPLHEYAGLGQRTLLLVVFSCRLTLAVRLLHLSPGGRPWTNPLAS